LDYLLTEIVTVGFGHGLDGGIAGGFIKVYFQFMP
jgi:hypothetical protein